MAIVDRLITEFTLKGDQYIASAKNIQSATRDMAGSIASAGVTAAKFAAGLGIAGAGAMTAFGVAAFNAYGRMESMKMGLVAVAGSAEEAEKQLARLKDVAKLPGLDLIQAIKGSIALQSVEFSAQEAEAAMKAFGNALATVGGGPAELEGLLYGLRQLGQSATVLGEDLNIVKDAVPQVAAALKRLYGSARSEDIAKMGIDPKQVVRDLTAELDKLPKVSGGAENAVVNLGAAIDSVMVAAGKSIAQFVVPVLEKVSGALEWLANSGVVEKASAGIMAFFDSGKAGDALVKAIFWVVAAIKRVPDVIKFVRDSWVNLIEGFRKGAIVAASAFVGIQTAATAMQVIVTVWKTIMAATKAATVAAMVWQSVMTGGLSLIPALGIGAGAAMATTALLEKIIPHVGDLGEIKAPVFDDIGKDADQMMQGYLKDLAADEARAEWNKQHPTEAAAGMGGMVSPAKAVTSALERNTEATDRLTSTQEKLVELNRQLQGGGAFAESAVSEIAIARATGRGTGLTQEAVQIAELVQRLAAKMGGAQVAANNRRLRNAGAF